jgi:hypothetical protein
MHKTIQFLHFHSPFDQQQLAAEYLCDEIPSLQVMGCSDDFWRIVHTSDDEALLLMTRREVL